MKLTNLFHFLMANMAMKPTYGRSGSDCGWLFGDALCPSNECCALDGKCGTSASFCGANKCQSGHCEDRIPVGQLGFCETSPTSKQGVMANLDLTINSGDRPKIDGVISMSGDGVYDSNGWTGDEYGSFTKLDMWNQGNEGKELWATGFIAYDCQNKILCVAAHLNEDLLHDSIPQSDAYSWIRFGFDNAEQKLFLHNTDVSEAAYALKPTNSSQAIGYEGCWYIQDHETFGRLAPVTNNYVTIHFDKDTSDGTRRNTVSTGMENGSGTVCLSQDCRTRRPTTKPTDPPTFAPTLNPTPSPSASPSASPSDSPSNSPSESPSISPSVSPSEKPSASPSTTPSSSPSTSPSASPSVSPSHSPSQSPSGSPSSSPSSSPSANPSMSPSTAPTSSPSSSPSMSPSTSPSSSPSMSPSSSPSASPSESPSTSPTSSPSESPSASPTEGPTTSPSISPSSSPSVAPSTSPSSSPSTSPSSSPSASPSLSPSASPSTSPSSSPSTSPSSSPTKSPSASPSKAPSKSPSAPPSKSPTEKPTEMPSLSPIETPLNNIQCCPENTGVCSAESPHTFNIPMLELTHRSYFRPFINGKINKFGDNIGDSPPISGWTAEEYSEFLEMPMFNGGKNGEAGSTFKQDIRIGTAYLAYDCANEIVCVAAHLDAAFLETNPTVQVEKDDGESWIRFGAHNGATKLKESNADEFKYVGKPNDADFVIGYEGCWSTGLIDGMESIVNNFVEVHFSNDGDTTSSGKPASNGEFVCLSPMCEPTNPSPVPPVAQRTMNPTTKPTLKPTVEMIEDNQCCPEDNGFCPTNGHTFSIPLLDLSPRGVNKPEINGDIGGEYEQFVSIPMFNGGKNGMNTDSSLEYTGRIGTAYLAYDCSENIVCAAAHLDSEFLLMNPEVTLQTFDEESWIRFGDENGLTKLKESNADEFNYVESGSGLAIGYEGCWYVDDAAMESIVNNFVEVHFSLWEGQTTSTGKPAADGEYVCLKPLCEAVVPERPSYVRGLRGVGSN